MEERGPLIGLLVAFVVMWGMAIGYMRETRLVTNFGTPFCEVALGPGWHPIGEGPDPYHTWCAMNNGVEYLPPPSPTEAPTPTYEELLGQ